MGVAGDIDQQVAEQAIDQPGWRRRALPGSRHHAERDLAFVQKVLPRLVDARCLAGRTDEQSGEQIGQRGPPLPVQQNAFQEIRPAQERAVLGRCPAKHHVVAAAGSGVPAVEDELVEAEAREARILVKTLRDVDGLAPSFRRMDVDLDDARIGRVLDDLEAVIARRRIAFDVDRGLHVRGRRLDGRQQLQIILELFQRRHENAQPAVARLDRERSSNRYSGSVGLGVRL